MTDCNNGYFTTDDISIKTLSGVTFPPDWWSRPYEYAWALRYTDKDYSVADMGCGWMGRPLSAELARQCKEVYAIDADDRVLSLPNEHKNLFYLSMDFTDTEMDYFADADFDVIFCISVIEDLSPSDRLNALKNFRRLIQPEGKIVITLDAIWDAERIAEPYPTVDIKQFIRDVKKTGLKFVGNVEKEIPDNAVHESRWNLACYHCLLERA